MERFLIFDAECLACSRLATEVRERSRGKLTPRSLHDPEITAMLDRERPSWRPQPMLITRTGDRIRIRTGLPMTLSLARLLGPARSLSLLRAMARQPADSEAPGISRRSAIGRALGTVGSVVVGAGTVDAATAAARTEGGRFITDASVRNWLRRQPEIAQAIKHLGEPDWHAVYLEDGAYVISHVNPPAKAHAAFTAISTDGQTAVSYAMVTAHGAPAMEVMSTAGHHYGTLKLKHPAGGKPRFVHEDLVPQCAAVYAGPDAVSFKFFGLCMVACIGNHVSEGCLESCYYCYAQHHPLSYSCIQCGMCAGPKTIKCSKNCSSQC